MLIAASYIRTGIPGEPVDIQKILIKMFAKANGLLLRDNLWFIDDGVSGFTPFLSRPGGRQIVEATEATHIDALIFADIGHAIRGSSDAVIAADYLQSLGLILLSAYEKTKASCRGDCLQDSIDRCFDDFYYEREERARRMIDGD